jgi:hypothetical protein
MFPLTIQKPPHDVEALREAMTASLRRMFRLPHAKRALRISGGDVSHLDAIDVNLTDAEIDVENGPDRPQPSGAPIDGPQCDALTIVGHPLHYQQASFDFELKATNVQLEFARDAEQKLVLMLQRAHHGTVEARITLDDLEQAVRQAAEMEASRHGIAIKNVRIELEQNPRKPNSLFADIEITARKLVSAVINIAGQIEVDDQLNVKFSKLSCEGQGMIGSMVCGFVRPHLAKMSNQRIELMAFSMGEVRLQNLCVKLIDDEIRAQAEFG